MVTRLKDQKCAASSVPRSTVSVPVQLWKSALSEFWLTLFGATNRLVCCNLAMHRFSLCFSFWPFFRDVNGVFVVLFVSLSSFECDCMMHWHFDCFKLVLKPVFALKVPAVFLRSSQRTIPSPTIPAIQTVAVVRVTMWIKRLTCWTSRWKGRPVLHTPTAPLRLRDPCSGPCGPPPVSAPPEVLLPAPPHLQVHFTLYSLSL